MIVDDVAPASPALDAGLRKGDRILTIGGRPVQRTLHGGPARDPLAPRRPRAGTSGATVTLRRGDETLTLELVPAEDEELDDEGLECDRWDATFQRITLQETPELHFWRPEAGIYVLGVSYPGQRRLLGPQAAGHHPARRRRGRCASLGDMKRIYERVLAEEREKKHVLFEVLRRGYRRLVALDYGPDYDQEK